MTRQFRISTALLAACFLFGQTTTHSEEMPALLPTSWRTCLQEAYQSHPALISAREKVKMARSDKWLAVSDYLPQVSISASESVTKTPHVKHTYDTDYSLTYSQLIFDSFKTPAEILASSRLLDAELAQYRETSAAILFELRSAYVELMRSQALIVLTEEIAQRRETNMHLVRLRYEAGRENKGSLLRSEADDAQAKFEIDRSKRELRVNQRRLNQALGRILLTPLHTQDEFETRIIPHEADIEKLAENNPTYQKALETRKSRRWNLVAEWSAFFPTLTFTLSENLGAPDSWRAVETHGWTALFKVSMPLFEGGTHIFSVRRAKASYNQAKADEHSAMDDVVLNLEDRQAKSIDASEFVQVRRKFVEAAQVRSEIAEIQYKNGSLSFEDFTIIEDELASAKRSYLDSQRDALIAEARWIQAEGLGFEYALEQNS